MKRDRRGGRQTSNRRQSSIRVERRSGLDSPISLFAILNSLFSPLSARKGVLVVASVLICSLAVQGCHNDQEMIDKHEQILAEEDE